MGGTSFRGGIPPSDWGIPPSRDGQECNGDQNDFIHCGFGYSKSPCIAVVDLMDPMSSSPRGEVPPVGLGLRPDRRDRPLPASGRHPALALRRRQAAAPAQDPQEAAGAAADLPPARRGAGQTGRGGPRPPLPPAPPRPRGGCGSEPPDGTESTAQPRPIFVSVCNLTLNPTMTFP